VQVVFEVGFLVGREELFDFGGVLAVFGGVESDHKDVLFSFWDEILNFRDFLSVGDHDAGVAVVLTQNIFEPGDILVGYKRDNIADIIEELEFKVGVVGFFVEEEGLFGLLVVEGIGQFFVVAVINNWHWGSLVFEPGRESNAVFIVADAFVFWI
jgi:hypothetical protein